MKPTRDQFEVESNVTGEPIAMGIDQDSMAHIMSVLTDLYSNKRLAIIREYSTNAFDAQLEAGVKRPIEITLPGVLAPFLTIQDFGTGLDADDIRLIYSQYGASTGRTSNLRNGMLGLGCKSALTYCSQFTVTSVKDGVRIVVNVGRDDEGGGTMTVVESSESAEENGTRVIIPINRLDIERVGDEARQFFRFWEPGTVLVNGKAPERFSGLRIADDLWLVPGSDALVVMGNVAYPAPELEALVPSSHGLVAFVPIGSVNFPPSREALMDTRTTRAALARIKERFTSEIRVAVQKEVDAAESAPAALAAAVRWKPIAGTKLSDLSYKGTPLPTEMRLPAYNSSLREFDQPLEAAMLVSPAGSGRGPAASKTFRILSSEWPQNLWVTGFAPAKWSAQHRRKALEWCTARGLLAQEKVWDYRTGDYVSSGDVASFVLLRGELPPTPFIDRSRIVAWEDIRKIRLDAGVAKAPSDRLPGSYDFWTEAGLAVGVAGDEIRRDCPIFYYQGNRWEASPLRDALGQFFPNYSLVCLSSNRIAKFVRILPAAKEALGVLKEKFTAWAATVTETQKTALTLRSRTRSTLLALDAGKIDDPALHAAIEAAKIDVKAIAQTLAIYRSLSVDTSGLDIDWVNPLDSYPLFEHGSRYSAGSRMLETNPSHVYAYFNAIYATKEADKTP